MSPPIDTAMILAAGVGSRMRPLTDTLPKPLVRVGRTPLIDFALRQVEHAGLSRVVVNVHYRADQVEAYLHDYAGPLDVMISDERDLLRETGGGVRHALPLIDRDTLVVMNADNIWQQTDTPAISQLLAAWQPDQMDVLLLLAPRAEAFGYDGAGDFTLGPRGVPEWRGTAADAPYVFAGIHILNTRLLRHCGTGAFSMTDIWRQAGAAGRLQAVVFAGRWLHVGTPEGVAGAARLLTP